MQSYQAELSLKLCLIFHLNHYLMYPSSEGCDEFALDSPYGRIQIGYRGSGPPGNKQVAIGLYGMDHHREAIVTFGSNCFSREVRRSSVRYVDDLKKHCQDPPDGISRNRTCACAFTAQWCDKYQNLVH